MSTEPTEKNKSRAASIVRQRQPLLFKENNHNVATLPIFNASIYTDAPGSVCFVTSTTHPQITPCLIIFSHIYHFIYSRLTDSKSASKAPLPHYMTFAKP